MGFIIDTAKDIVDEVFDFVEDVLEEVVSWLIDIPDQPDLDKLLQGDGVLVNKRNSDSPLPVIYGTRRIGFFRHFI